MPQRKARARANKRNNNNQNNQLNIVSMTSKPTYKNEPIIKMVLPATTSTVNATAGVSTGSLPITLTAINGFTTRFGTTFDEARILSVTLEITPLTINTNGVTAFYWSERNISAGSLQQATSRNARLLSNSSSTSDNTKVMKWTADSFSDLEWQSVLAVVTTPAYFNYYTDAANYSTTASAPLGVFTGPLWLMRPVYTVQFRGAAST